MIKPWSAEVEVDREMATALIYEQFSIFVGKEVKLIGEGWDNFAYLVDERVVFRFPRREISVKILLNERKMLRALEGLMPVAVPVPRYEGKPSGEYPWHFLGSEYVVGKTMTEINLGVEGRKVLAKGLGNFLRKLHGVDVEWARERGAVEDEIDRMDFKKRAPMGVERLQAIEALGLVEEIGIFSDFLNGCKGVEAYTELRLNHGDLYCAHIVVDEGGKLEGVIDWGDVHIGDPALDLGVLPQHFPVECHGAFWEAYGRGKEEGLWRRMLFRAIYHNATIVVYGHDKRDSGLVREGLCGLEWIRSQLA